MADYFRQLSALQRGIIYLIACPLIFAACEDDPPPLMLTLSPLETATLAHPLTVNVSSSESISDVTWRIIEQPLGALSTLEPRDLDPREPQVTEASIVPRALGRYVISVRVQRGDRSATKELDFEVSCAPPQWTIELNLDPPQEVNLVGRSIGLNANIRAAEVEGCPVVEAPPFDSAWSLRSWPADSAVDSISHALEMVTDTYARLTPLAQGDYLVHLTVNDALGRRNSANLNINVSCGSTAPLATATLLEGGRGNGDQSITVGVPVVVSLTGEDPDASCLDEEATLEKSWRWSRRPAGSQAELNDGGLGQAQFTPDIPGVYELSGAVIDREQLRGEARLSLEAGLCNTRPPQINSINASPSRLELGAFTELSLEWRDSDLTERCGETSNDDYLIAWSVLSAPPQSVASPSPIDGASPTFTPDQPGIYTLEVTITDPTGLTASSSLEVEVIRCSLRSLVINAQASAPLINIGEISTLSAHATLEAPSIECAASQDPLNLTYEWRTLSLPAGAAPLMITDRPTVSWLAEVSGDYLFEVIAHDSRGRTSPPALVPISVTPCGSAAPLIEEVTHEGALAVGRSITLSAVAQDPDLACGLGRALSYQWRVIARPRESRAQFTLERRSDQRPSLTIDRSGEYTLQLIVTDESQQSTSRNYTFSVASCGEARPTLQLIASSLQPLIGQWVSLRAEAQDPDSAIGCDQVSSFEYQWTIESLPIAYEAHIVLSGARPHIFIEQEGLYRVSVVAIDQTGRRSNVIAIELQAQSCGASPPVITGVLSTADNAQIGQEVRLEAEVNDPDAQCGLDLSNSASFRWQLISAPIGSQASLSASQTPTLVPDISGNYRVRVIAETIDGLISAPFDYLIQANGCGGFPPLIDEITLSAPNLRVGEEVRFTVSSDDPDRVSPCELIDPHESRWRLLSAPPGSLSDLRTPRSSTSSLNPDLPGEYKVEVIVTDSSGRDASAQQTINIASCGQDRPLLNPLSISSASVLIGETVTLSAESIPPDVSCVEDQRLSWEWRVIARPLDSQATLSSLNAERPSFSPDRVGVYHFEARVISVNGQISEAQRVTLTVRDCGSEAPQVLSLSAPTPPPEGLVVGELLSLSAVGNSPNEDCGLDSDVIAEWTLDDRPIGSGVSLNRDGPLAVSLIPDLEGVYIISMSLFDRISGLRSAPEYTTLTVGVCGAIPPRALISSTAPTQLPAEPSIALNAYTCQDSSFLQLDASESEDVSADACGINSDFTYRWSVKEVSAGLTIAVVDSDREAVNLSVTGLAINQSGTTRIEVEVENQLGLSDIAEAEVEMTRLSPPNAQTVSPDFFCVGERTITIVGREFLSVDGALPTVAFGEFEFIASAARGCVQIDQSTLQQCTELDVIIPDGLESDLYSVSVRNPYPLACADEGLRPTVLLISAPRINETAPDPICRGQFAGDITLNGAGFLREEGGETASVSVNGIAVTPATLDGCIEAGNQISTCSSARFTLPPSQSDIRDLNILVVNPPTSGCAPEDLRAEILLQQSEPPVIDEIEPRKICDQGGSLSLIGDHFEPNMTVDMGPYRADRVVSTNGELEVDAIWDRQEQARFIPGEYLVTARNATGCEETFPDPILVTEGPVPFFVDPPVIYSGINLQATAYLGNLFGGSVSKAEIQTGAEDPIELEFSTDPNKPSIIQLIIPSGLPSGLYDLTLYDEVDCPGTTESLLRVTSDLSVTINEVSPPFAWVNSFTSVTVLADPSASFIPTPRSYLSPSIADECSQDGECGGDVCRLGRCVSTCAATRECAQGDACVSSACVPQAAELRAASLNSLEELKGVVAAGFSPGLYDLIAVNPDGTVGLLERAIKVNPLPPPQVTSVSPGSWEVNVNALPIQVSGTNFREPAVSITCFDGGVPSSLTSNITSQTATLINLTIDTNTLSSTSICSVRVTNSDEAYSDFSPLTATNPSGNFVDFNLGPDLPADKARRLSAVTFAQVPNGPPRLYVFGGDTGSDQNGLDDNLSIGINSLGALETWQTLPTTLPNRFTRIEAHTIGRFIYILGGFNADSNSASNDILRAEVLDPLYAPTIDQVDFEFDAEVDGLDTGIYYYRVSAIYGANDPNNPSGESLPSEPQPVFIPNIPVGVRLKLTWTGLPDAVGYRVYRSPTPDLLFGQEELIAEVPQAQLQLFDVGQAPLSNQRPLSIGELGNWSVVGDLLHTRTEHATAVAVDPINPALYHLYTFGGLADGVLSDGYDLISIDVSAPRDHIINPTQRFDNALSTARRQLKASIATTREASELPPGESYVYVFGGLDSDNVDVAQINPGGLLSAFNRTEDMQRSRQGYYATIANNNALSICGQGGSASSTAEKGVLCGVNGTGRNCDRPEYISKWSSLGGTGAQACVNPGGAAARGFLYLIGGGDSSGVISSKVDISLLGGTP